MNLDLDDAETAALHALLADAVAKDRYPFSPRHRRWRSILEKLGVGSTYRGPVYPTPKPPDESSLALRKKRRR